MLTSERAGLPPASAALVPAAVPIRRERWLLNLPDFRRLWLIGLVVFAVRWLEMLVVGVFVYQHTGSAFQVAMMTLLRMAPMVIFGPLIGAYVERFERRGAQIVVSLSLLATAVALAASPSPGSSKCGILRSPASATASPGPPIIPCGG